MSNIMPFPKGISDSINITIFKLEEDGYGIMVGDKLTAARSSLPEVIEWTEEKTGGLFKESPKRGHDQIPMPRVAQTPPMPETDETARSGIASRIAALGGRASLFLLAVAIWQAGHSMLGA